MNGFGTFAMILMYIISGLCYILYNFWYKKSKKSSKKLKKNPHILASKKTMENDLPKNEENLPENQPDLNKIEQGVPTQTKDLNALWDKTPNTRGFSNKSAQIRGHS